MFCSVAVNYSCFLTHRPSYHFLPRWTAPKIAADLFLHLLVTLPESTALVLLPLGNTTTAETLPEMSLHAANVSLIALQLSIHLNLVIVSYDLSTGGPPPGPRGKAFQQAEPNDVVGIFGLSMDTREADVEDLFDRVAKPQKVTIGVFRLLALRLCNSPVLKSHHPCSV